MSSNKRRFMKVLLKANVRCGCSKLKSSEVHEPTPKPKISIYQNTNLSSLNSSTTSSDHDNDDEIFTSTTISEPDTNQQNKNNMSKPSQKLVDSIAIEMKSNDPHKDFRASMLQMILEREIYTETDLQELLECFLQLNATCHHHVIVQAFIEICEEVFPKKNIISGGGGAPIGQQCHRN